MKASIFHAAIFTPTSGGRWGLPIVIEDQPGTAKTAFAKAYGESWGLPVEHLSPSTRGEGAFGCVPVPVKGKLTYPAADWVDALFDGGIVFVDEITTAPPGLQAPILGLVSDRVIGSYQLGPRVRVVAACNPVEQAANGHDLAPPLANRFGWLSWGCPTVEEHASYMMGAGAHEEVVAKSAVGEESRVLREWPEAYAFAVGLETAFLRSFSHYKNRMPKVDDVRASRAWPSDRTWEYATRAFAAARIHGLTDAEREDFIAAFIGNEAMAAWMTFVEQADMPSPVDILDGTVEFKWDAKRLDRSAAIITACAALVIPAAAEKRAARAEKLWMMLDGSSNYDVTIPVVQALVKASLHVNPKIMPILAKLYPVFNASGIAAGRVL